MAKIELVDHRRLSERAYELIKEHILTADLRDQPPGSRLDEKLLCDQLRMSRTPVREAINRLAAEGLVKLVPYKGVFIARKTSEEIIEFLMVRATLEGMAARLATENFVSDDFVTMKDIFLPFLNAPLKDQRYAFSQANIKFHEFVLGKSGCKPLIDMAKGLYDLMRLIRFRTSAFLPRLESALQQHFDLVDIFENRDPDLAERVMRAHIEESAQYIKQWEEIHNEAMSSKETKGS